MSVARPSEKRAPREQHVQHIRGIEPLKLPTKPRNPPLGDQLKIEEYKILRGEIELRSSEGRTMERNVMIISAVIYGFLPTPKSGNLSALDERYADRGTGHTAIADGTHVKLRENNLLGSQHIR